MSPLKSVLPFLQRFATRPNMTHVAFLTSVAGLTYGAHHLGQALGLDGLGAICGSLALMFYAYLLGAE